MKSQAAAEEALAKAQAVHAKARAEFERALRRVEFDKALIKGRELWQASDESEGPVRGYNLLGPPPPVYKP